MKLILFVVAVLALSGVGCATREEKAAWAVENIRYLKDTRTGLCFASYSGDGSQYLTCVPCDSLYKQEWQQKIRVDVQTVSSK